jgi:lipopolysaccharide export system protein LptA
MIKRILTFLILVATAFPARAQLGSFADVPVEIDAEQTRFVGGVAVAEGDVEIRYGGTNIRCDYAEYNPDTRDALLRGNIRVFRESQMFTAERAFYNFETKLFRAADVRGEAIPFRFAAETLGSLGANSYRAVDGVFTTSDSSKPDYHLRARSIRIYPDDRVVFSRVSLVVGRTPIFWWPYLVQSLEDEAGFTLSPGYRSGWGAFLLTTYTFPLADNMTGKFRFDLRSERGVGVGMDITVKSPKDPRNWALFRGYYGADSNQDEDRMGDERSGIDQGRYRLSWQQRLYFTDDIYASVDINALSDRDFLEDYFETEFRLDPQPDNVVTLTKWDENYTLSMVTRFQVNDFQETTERLPELVWDGKRQPLFGSGFFYEGETGLAYLRRQFPETPLDEFIRDYYPDVYNSLSDEVRGKLEEFSLDDFLRDYDSVRFDTFHQVTYPGTYFGWLAFVPRVGLRATAYSDSIGYENRNYRLKEVDAMGNETELSATVRQPKSEGAVIRPVISGGFEASFKASRAWDGVQSRALGLDGVMHVVQPYTNLSLVYSGTDPDELLQFDRYIASTELSPIDFAQFNAVDSISSWSIWRWGVRNRWLTRRDNDTHPWLEMDTYFDMNLVEPEFPGVADTMGFLSNLQNRWRWRPLPWLTLDMRSQIPLSNEGFTQFNTQMRFQVHRDVELTLGHRFIDDNPFFEDSNLVTVGSYLRLGDNWGFSIREQYEMDTSTLESQRYEIHRDLSSWVASLGVIVRDNGDENDTEYGVLFTVTLKDLPQVKLPVNFDTQGSEE